MIKPNPFGKPYSWVYDNYSPDLKSLVVDIQWLRWQGHEFRIVCNSKSEMVGVIKLLGDAISVPVRNYQDGHAHTRWDFETDNYTFSPSDIKRICGDFVQIILTPTTLKTREILMGDENDSP